MRDSVHVEASSRAEIADALRQAGLDQSADRLDYLWRLAEEDPDEEPIALESLRQLTTFLINERELGEPQIGVSPDGVALAQWRVLEAGILAMEFLGSELIRFAGTTGPASQDGESLRVSGALPTTRALQVVKPFLS